MTAPTQTPIYLHAEFDVHRSDHQKFVEKMREILPVIFDHYRWELVYAAYPIAGKLNRFTHIWRIPSESSVLKVMRDGAAQDGRGGAARRDADVPPRSAPVEVSRDFVFKTLYRELQGMISETVHILSTSLSHDPTYFGEQGETLLIDKNGETFQLSHEQMREKWADYDISGELEKARAKRWKVWRNAEALKGARTGRPKHQPDTERPRNELLQSFLNQGALVAVLPTSSGGNVDTNQSLLFNLAGIKPRSVFQEDTDAVVPTALKKAAGDQKVEFPEPVKTLIITTPWGSVYEVNAKQVEDCASPIPADKVAATANILVPMIDAKVPLANIPEERDDVIGDGCMCYVINLSSFTQDCSSARGKQASLQPKR